MNSSASCLGHRRYSPSYTTRGSSDPRGEAKTVRAEEGHEAHGARALRRNPRPASWRALVLISPSFLCSKQQGGIKAAGLCSCWGFPLAFLPNFSLISFQFISLYISKRPGLAPAAVVPVHRPEKMCSGTRTHAQPGPIERAH